MLPYAEGHRDTPPDRSPDHHRGINEKRNRLRIALSAEIKVSMTWGDHLADEIYDGSHHAGSGLFTSGISSLFLKYIYAVGHSGMMEIL